MKPKKNSKADLNKRTIFFLQLGLITVLFSAYLVMEWKTYAGEERERLHVQLESPDEEIIPVTIVKTTPPPKLPVIPDVIEPVPDEKDVEEDIIPSTESSQEDIAEIEDIPEVPKDDPIESVPFHVIESVPVFPGCENLQTNEEQRQCMSEKISRFVNKHFDTSLGEKLGLTGVNRVFVQFQIDPQGNITEVRSRAPHPKLKQEAVRVINSLPKMQPGKQRGKPVPVSYSIPIMFQVQE